MEIYEGPCGKCGKECSVEDEDDIFVDEIFCENCANEQVKNHPKFDKRSEFKRLLNELPTALAKFHREGNSCDVKDQYNKLCICFKQPKSSQELAKIQLIFSKLISP